MVRNGPFKGRTVAVVNDLGADEQLYLYRKARELKEAALAGRDVSGFRLDERDYQVYLIFMDDSTRTRESFRNAAGFLGSRVNVFDAATSSFNKNESIADTIKMLAGYAEDSAFVIRSKLEGVCRGLEGTIGRFAEQAGRPRPAFVNAGDGKHEHPTQEFLDEFSFLEQLDWKRDRIHLALTGDLYHGRTVHSKVDGLGIYKEVTVDLVAPELLGMPAHYVEKMRRKGYEVRLYESIDEYLAAGKVAPIWYFTRLQLERMGDAVLEKADSLRGALTFRRDQLGRLPEGARFYHPLPRDRAKPTNPQFLDELPLNGWDAQSANGYWTRIVLLGMVSGLLGADYQGARYAPESYEDDFVKEAPVELHSKPEYKVGIKPVEEGIVIDHIASGRPIGEIWDYVDAARRILSLNVRSSHGVYHTNSGDFKGIISLPDVTSFGERDLKKLAAIAPGCTLNLIRGHRVVKKYRLQMPPRIYSFDEISCKNPACVSAPAHQEGLSPEFLRKAPAAGESATTFVCKYCEKEHAFREIWDV
ncbi:MAG: aspartate carbamoyltransferase [Spirochaetaceae bacterium]|nr:aspartate carbamoyltransferase [Spirochaetaceae bacterium]